MDSVKITALELENVKRVRAVALSPSPTGLTVIGGRNAQGKTSVLDGIVYALGGEKHRPTNLQHEGALADARIELRLSNGLVVERKGKNAALKVTDPTGKKSGQKVLDDFVEELALDLPKFLAMPDDEKAVVLLKTLGIGDQLKALDEEERAAYEKRHAYGVVADQKLKFWREMPEYHDCPEQLVSASALIGKSQEILSRNGERARARARLVEIQREHDSAAAEVERMEKLLTDASARYAAAASKLELARSEPIPADESTAEIQRQIDELETTNAKVRANADKAKAKEDSDACQAEYSRLTEAVEAIRDRRRQLLAGAQMPMDELTIGKNAKERPCLLYKGQPWDCMSGMEQMRVAVSIVRRLKPECGFVLLDGLESFDMDELAKFAAWLESNGLQAIATRVSDGAECSVVIEDGVLKEEEQTKGNLF